MSPMSDAVAADHCFILDYSTAVVGCTCGWRSGPIQDATEYNQHIIEAARPIIARKATETWRRWYRETLDRAVRQAGPGRAVEDWAVDGLTEKEADDFLEAVRASALGDPAPTIRGGARKARP